MDLAFLPSAVPAEIWRWQFAERFEILKLLAQGGQGTIYAARDCRTGQHVALKLIDGDDGGQSQNHEYLMSEAGICNCLSCEHVVTVFDAGWDCATGFSYLTMELLDGTDLQRHVEREGPLAAARVVEYLRQVAVGLDELHNWHDAKHRLTPIVHRDLKPANLFLSKREDGSPLIKILDFGIAKVVEHSKSVSFPIRGSPLYMAPEQVSGGHLSPATDIWAMGLLAFFLLTGKAYWLLGQQRRCALPALFKEVAFGATVVPSVRVKQLNVPVELPHTFDKWFLRCVHPDPRQRFESAGECVLALANALEVTLCSTQIRRPGRVLSLRLLGSIAPRPNWRRFLWFLVGVVGGFGAVVGPSLWIQQNVNSQVLRRLEPQVISRIASVLPQRAIGPSCKVLPSCSRPEQPWN